MNCSKEVWTLMDIQCRDIELLYFKKFSCILQVMELIRLDLNVH